MDADWVESERQRARDLLAPEYTGVAVEPSEPDPPPAEVGALAGVGLLVVACGVRLSVYVFGDWQQGQAYARAIESRPRADGSTVRATANGALLLVGSAPGDRPEAAEVLATLASAFAGWE